MSDTKVFQRSFSGGEVSPDLFGRIDDARFQSGLSRMRNFIPWPQGAARYRPGFQYVRETKYSNKRSRLLKFDTTAEEEIVVEFGDGYFRFHTAGATLLAGASSPHVAKKTGTIDAANDRITIAAHGIPNYTPITVSWDTTMLPSAYLSIDPNRVYYSYADGVNNIKLLPSATSTTTLALDVPASTGVVVSYAYNYGDVVTDAGNTYYCIFSPPQGTPPTLPAALNVTFSGFPVNRVTSGAAHGLHIGAAVVFSGTSLPDGIEAGRTYYVITTPSNVLFQISQTRGGPAHSFSTGATSETAQLVACWYQLPAGNLLEFPHPYTEAQLDDVHVWQSGDVMSIAHCDHPLRELVRLGATAWGLRTVPMIAPLSPPISVSVTPFRGRGIITTASTAPAAGEITFLNGFPVAMGDTFYLRAGDGSGIAITGITTPPGNLNDNYYSVGEVTLTAGVVTGFRLRSIGENAAFDFGAGVFSTPYPTVHPVPAGSETSQTYGVTAIDASGIESAMSAAVTTNNVIDVLGASNTLSWSAVSGAARYRVYRLQNGLFGFMGEVEGLSFIDDGEIAPDLSRTPPRFDSDLSGTEYPCTGTYFEQRRVLAGTTERPQNVWLTRTGTESDLSYHIPVQDDDRIAARIATYERVTIRHAVALDQLLLLTSTAEFRCSPVNSDVLTPSSFSARPQTYVGASKVQPVIVNNQCVFVAARGGHLRELGYAEQAGGYINGDLSLRATHLFDEEDITAMSMGRAPLPIIWCISTSGQLLGLTYVPEEQIGAWHVHETTGTFEACVAVQEDEEDRLYVVVQRTVGGQVKRYVERMWHMDRRDIHDSVHLDASLVYDGTGASTTSVTVSGGISWTNSDLLTLTASVATWTTAPTEVRIEFGGETYTFTVVSAVSTSVLRVRIASGMVPTGLRNVAQFTWANAVVTISGLPFPNGTVLTALHDDTVTDNLTVTTGAVTLPAASVRVCLGLRYTGELQVLPLAVATEGFGQGRMRVTDRAVLRLVHTAPGLRIGNGSDDLANSVPVTQPVDADGLYTGEVDVVVPPGWADGSVRISTNNPTPATIVSITQEATVGG